MPCFLEALKGIEKPPNTGPFESCSQDQLGPLAPIVEPAQLSGALVRFGGFLLLKGGLGSLDVLCFFSKILWL